MKLANKIKSMTQNLSNSIRLPFRGVLSATKSDQKIQGMQIKGLDGETIQDAEFYQQFGFTSNPPAGTNVIILPLNGNTSHGVIIATENGSFRVQSLKPGEACVYDQSGSTITLKNNKIVDIECDELNIKCKKYTCKSDTADFDISDAFTVKSSTVDINASSVMTLHGMPSITLDTPMTIITGGITASGTAAGASKASKSASYAATFSIPVAFAQPSTFDATSIFNAQAQFKVALVAVDAVINDVRHKDHVHTDSVGGKTKEPKNP